MSLEAAIQSAINSIPECVAGGYVDMATGMLLGVKTVESHRANLMDRLGVRDLPGLVRFAVRHGLVSAEG